MLPPPASAPDAQHSPETKTRRYLRLATVTGFLLFALLLLVARAMPREASRDEEQFISAGALLVRDGLLPYVDYPYFHLPNLAFVYAGLFAASDHLLLVARSFNVLCGWLTVLLIFALAARAFHDARSARLWLAAAAAAAVVASPLFGLTSGSAWNHDLAVLTATAAFAAMLRAFEPAAARWWMVAAGALLGIAIGTRLSFLPLLLPFVCFAVVGTRDWPDRLARVGLFATATVVALSPTILLALSAPEQFFFGNFVYNGPLNRAYRAATGNPGIDLSSKFLFAIRMLKFPHNIALIGAFAYLAIWRPARHGWKSFLAQRNIAFVVACVLFLSIGALAPSPSYKQYYYAFVPFLVLACVFGFTRAMRHDSARRPALAASALALISVAAIAVDLPLLRHLAAPGEWPVVRVHALGRELREQTSGPVLTLSPILPLEAGLDIYKEFATGPFAWRTAAFLPPGHKAVFGMVDAASLEAFLATASPPAILTPVTSTARNRPLAVYAQSHGYRRVRLHEDVDLWLRAE